MLAAEVSSTSFPESGIQLGITSNQICISSEPTDSTSPGVCQSPDSPTSIFLNSPISMSERFESVRKTTRFPFFEKTANRPF